MKPQALLAIALVLLSPAMLAEPQSYCNATIASPIAPYPSRVTVKVHCNTPISEVKVYYDGLLLYSKVRVSEQKTSAIVEIEHAPPEGDLHLLIVLATGHAVNLTLTLKPNATWNVPVVDESEARSRIESIIESYKQAFENRGITPVLGDEGASVATGRAGGRGVPLQPRHEGEGASWVRFLWDNMYVVLALTAVLYLLARYRHALRHA